MPAFRYLAEYSRIYADRSLLVEPGDVVDWPEAPDDGQWGPVEDIQPGEGGDNFPDEQARAEEDAAQQASETVADAPKKTTTRRAAPAQTTEE